MASESTSFFIGRNFDPSSGKATDQKVFYDPADLTTHAIVTGMTGSGKTGLCIDFLEEAALQKIPALIIDPKGDLTNLLLHFPGLAPADFQPWLDSEMVRRSGKPADQVAAETAAYWKNGLADWGIGPERIAALQDSVQFSIFTPGSDAGLPVSVLASLQAPEIPWEGNKEILREKISSTVTALLGLIGLNDLDPVRSREHILLSNLFETAWSSGKSLDLAELILQTQTPPFDKLGVFPLDSFFPAKDRMELAVMLNNFLASPSFQSWLEGESLDAGRLLYTPDGKPRHSIFYIAHLSDAERMFFVTLLLSALESWMRTQTGTSNLRAMLYFDEIMGYLPPVGNPASKAVLLRLLKQARAFGVGLLLATQNPVDVDYKALSNAGTWMIGRLQTDQDKQRLLDGLEGAGDTVDRGTVDKMISGLGKRVFLLHNTHTQNIQLFSTRWTMNYLAGPLTTAQIPALNRLTGAAQPEVAAPTVPISHTSNRTVAPLTATPPAQPASGTATRPAVPNGINEIFFPNNLSLTDAAKDAGLPLAPDARQSGIHYRPVLFGQAQVRYLDRKNQLDQLTRRTVLISAVDRRGMVRWDHYSAPSIDSDKLESQPVPGSTFAAMDPPLSDAKLMSSLEKDFADWVYRSSQLKLRSNAALKIIAPPEMDDLQFKDLCSQTAVKARDAEAEKATLVIDRKIEALKSKLQKEQLELDQDKSELNQRKIEEVGTGLETVIGLLGGRKRSVSSTLSKHRMASNAKADVTESEQTIQELTAQIAALEKEKSNTLEKLAEKWQKVAEEVSESAISPQKKDVYVEVFGVAWAPYYLVQTGGQTQEIPAYRL